MGGLKVNVTVRKNEEFEEELEEYDDDGTVNDLKIYKMEVECKGHYNRKATWEDISSYWEKPINKDNMRDLVDDYILTGRLHLEENENHHPKNCYIKDEPRKGITFYKDFDWDPVKLHLKGYGKIDIEETWTRHVKIESFPLDYSTDLEKTLLDQGDKKVISTLKKSKLGGHPLALSMMKSDSKLSTEFRGMESVVFILGNKEEPDEIDETTGDSVWKDVKSLRALLKDKPLPQKKGAGTTRVVEVVALESYLKARIYYQAYFKGDLVTDHGTKLFDGNRYWNFTIDGILRHHHVENSAEIYEDIELHFYSEVQFKMDNKDFEWGHDDEGRWVKKYRQPQRTKSADGGLNKKTGERERKAGRKNDMHTSSHLG